MLKLRQHIRCKPTNLCKLGNYQSGPLDADPIDGVMGLKRKKKSWWVEGLKTKKSHLSPHPLDHQYLVVMIGIAIFHARNGHPDLDLFFFWGFHSMQCHFQYMAGHHIQV